MSETRATKTGRTVYIVDGSRAPCLKTRGIPGPFSASDLAVNSARPLLARQPFEAGNIDQVILGCIMPGPDEANIARVVALRLGCGKYVPAWTVQRNCGSGMQAIDSAARDIASGHADLVLAGGAESMSHAPLLFSTAMVTWLGQFSMARDVGAKLKAAIQFRPGLLKPVIALLRGLTDPVVGLSMGQTAEVLAHRFGVTREMMDSYSVRSHQRLAAAFTAGRLSEIEVIYDWQGKFYDQDDGVRPDSSVEKLAKLKPVFDKEFGLVTAGNSAQVTDSAAWVILASEPAVKKYQLPVMARIVDSEWAGLEPQQMGLGPVHAMTPLMKRQKLEISDIDYFEINEAFAAQVLACLVAWQDKEYCRTELHMRTAMGEINQDRLNVDGGGISLGHPVGVSGARIVLHLCHVLQHNGANRGIASLCIGGGQGGAMLIERDAA
ncbi:MAG: acetyl-CoA C-acetyltransferase [Gammaproteobacteria bacterium]|nr:acetyl-CoA C-acetyltransferase [Gammaproteobacteria bacterium]